MAQMVCGSCLRLLKYPQGSRHVKCSCCDTINFVLEAHEVGQVKCGSCGVLLMYPYGASSVKCSSCSFVTEIGVCELLSCSYRCQFLPLLLVYMTGIPWILVEKLCVLNKRFGCLCDGHFYTNLGCCLLPCKLSLL
ncbi:Protein LOL2 [Morella rubra]|uniref:Protein LOL2 n=1 Tax=Morella rubra TaxID=262757 RepID=A0A6A1ULI9_9ROSI|nr:Protein LOL2 [Morella rubra]